MVATFNPSWRSITDALRLAVIAAGGIPSVTTYPANWGGVIRAVQDLQAALVTAGNANAVVAAHVALADPHAQYALDTDLAAYATTANLGTTSATLSSHTGNTSNPHSTTAAQVGAIATTAAGAASGVATLDGSVKVPIAQLPAGTASGVATLDGSVKVPIAQLPAGTASGVATLDGSTKVPIGQLPTGATVATVAIGNDARLSDTRSPTALSVVDGSVSASAAIAWSKISKSGAVASDVSASPATHATANANVHGLPASVNVLGNRNASGEFIQRGNGTANSALGSYTINSFRTIIVTFPVAFAAIPRVFVTGSNNELASVGGLSTTGCTLLAWGDPALDAIRMINYFALGT